MDHESLSSLPLWTQLTVVVDHSAVMAVLTNPGANGRYVRWWIKLYGSGVKNVRQLHTNALSHQPYLTSPDDTVASGDLQVCAISSI